MINRISAVLFTILTKTFFFRQKSYGNTTRFIFFSQNFFFQLGPGPREVPKWKFASVRLKTLLYATFVAREFLCVKTLLGIQWFEVHFRAIFSYFYLFRFRTQVSHQKSLNIFLRPLYSVYNDMTEDFFMPKVLWEHHSIQFFFTDFFFSYAPAPRKISKLNLLR